MGLITTMPTVAASTTTTDVFCPLDTDPLHLPMPEYRHFRERQHPDRDLHYIALVLASWPRLPVEAAPEQASNHFVAQHRFGVTEANAALTLTYFVSLLPAEVGVADWTLAHLAPANGRVVGIAQSATELDVLFHSASSYERLRVLRNGRAMLAVRAGGNADAFRSNLDKIAACLSSFQPLHPAEHKPLEPTRTSYLGGPLNLYFDHPQTWHAQKIAGDETLHRVHLANMDNGTRAGTVLLWTTNTPNHPNLLLACRDYLAQQGLELHGGDIEVIPATPPFKRTQRVRQTGRYKQTPLDCDFILNEHDKSLVVTALISPTRQASPAWWAINRRAFDIVHTSTVSHVLDPVTEHYRELSRSISAQLRGALYVLATPESLGSAVDSIPIIASNSSPRLCRVLDLSAVLPKVWPKQSGILLCSDLSTAEVAAHIQRQCVIQRADGSQKLFHAERPQTLLAFLRACTPTVVANFFGPIHRLFCPGTGTITHSGGILDVTEWES